MRDLPRSIFSTPGAKALVCDGTVPRAVGKEYEMYWGLKIVRVVRTAVNQRISFPCFGDLTTELKGGEKFSGPFLAKAAFCEEGTEDLVGLVGSWVHSKASFEKYYGKKSLRGILATDAASKRAWNDMDEDACILDDTWTDHGVVIRKAVAESCTTVKSLAAPALRRMATPA